MTDRRGSVKIRMMAMNIQTATIELRIVSVAPPPNRRCVGSIFYANPLAINWESVPKGPERLSRPAWNQDVARLTHGTEQITKVPQGQCTTGVAVTDNGGLGPCNNANEVINACQESVL